MKRLLTFIYGLMLFAFSFSVLNRFENTTDWYRWLYFLAALLIVLDGFKKLNKATKDK